MLTGKCNSYVEKVTLNVNYCPRYWRSYQRRRVHTDSHAQCHSLIFSADAALSFKRVSSRNVARDLDRTNVPDFQQLRRWSYDSLSGGWKFGNRLVQMWPSSDCCVSGGGGGACPPSCTVCSSFRSSWLRPSHQMRRSCRRTSTGSSIFTIPRNSTSISRQKAIVASYTSW